MRWKDTRPHHGQVRIVKRFLWLPKTAYSGEGTEESITRWLEVASWKERFHGEAQAWDSLGWWEDL